VADDCWHADSELVEGIVRRQARRRSLIILAKALMNSSELPQRWEAASCPKFFRSLQLSFAARGNRAGGISKNPEGCCLLPMVIDGYALRPSLAALTPEG
jgi:hypothetical protein